MADRARDPEALEREIEATRRELAQTIDAIADRVNPRNVAQRGVTRLKEEAGQAAAAVGALLLPAHSGQEGEREEVDRRIVAAGVGAVVAVTVFLLWRRSRRRRRG